MSVATPLANSLGTLRYACTPIYASPQQERGDDPDPRDDVFALGVIWYQLLLHNLTRSTRPGWAGARNSAPWDWARGTCNCWANALPMIKRTAHGMPKSCTGGLAALAADTPSVSRAKQAAIAPDVKTPAPVPPTAKPRKAGDVISPTLKMTFKYIEPGTFWMGSPDTDHEASADEKPQHQVTISKPFYLGTHQVTRGRFQQFVRNTGYKTDAEKSGGNMFGLARNGTMIQRPAGAIPYLSKPTSIPWSASAGTTPRNFWTG